MSGKRGSGRRTGGRVVRQSPTRTARVVGTAASVPAPRLARPGAASPALEVGARAALRSTAQRSTSLLELVGATELQRALADFEREQDRLANRAWRRPGGLARMGWV